MKYLFTVSLVVSLTLFAFCPVYAANEIVVGCIADLTGTYAALSKQQKDAVNMAVNEINESGGLLGRKLRVVLEDSATSVSTATQKLERLIMDEKVDFIIPPTTSSAVLAMMPVVNKYNKLMMVSLAQSVKITGENKNKQTFRTFANPEITAVPMVKWMMANLGKKYYLLTVDYAWGRSASEVYNRLLKQAGANIAGETFFPLNTKDFASYFGKIKAAKPDVLFIVAAGNDAISAVSQVEQYRLNKTMHIAGDGSLVSGDIIAAEGKSADGIIIADFYADTLSSKENRAWVDKYVKLYAEKPSKMAVSSYEAVMWIAQAIKQTGSVETDKLIRALEGSTYKGPQGTMWMDPSNHQSTMDVYMIKIENATYKIIGKAN